MFERPKIGERVVLVHIDFDDKDAREDILEFQELAISAGTHPVAMIGGTRHVPEAKYFVGSGKAEEIQNVAQECNADVVLFNHVLCPSQERNLEQLINCRVVDRTGLILDIFAQRARTFEGKLQVELAQLQHLSTRLVRGWTHLERQKGGIGLRGPGETQLETDRRLLRDRVKHIEKRLDKVRQQREQSRQARRRAALPTVSIVGYTNAGKSSLFNRLTGSDIYTANQLFATLDPTLRKLTCRGSESVILADTVGFIRHLPHHLIDAFRATLEETREASLLLHVIDVNSPNRQDNIQQVETILQELGVGDIPAIRVYNKIDLIEEVSAREIRGLDNKPEQIWLSTKTGDGVELLKNAISDHIFGDPVYRTISLGSQQGKLRAELYQKQAVLHERIDDQGNWIINIRLPKNDYSDFISKMNRVTDLILSKQDDVQRSEE